MLTPEVKTELQATVLEHNQREVQRTLEQSTHLVLPQHTTMFTLWNGELVTFAQAIELRDSQ